MRNYKLSNYNYYRHGIRFIYIYNTKSGLLCKLSKNEYNKLKKNKLNDIEELGKLIDAGFLVYENVNELNELEELFNQSRYSKEEISITFAPTLNCNFNCAYCYEQKSLDQMKKDNFLQLLKFLKKTITEETKVVNFSWFGGEPMLSKSLMIKFIDSFKEFCDNLNIKLQIYVITNGYILDQEIIDFYVKYLNNLDICITIDGVGKQHDKKRPLSPCHPSFDKIISNIKTLNANAIYPTIRINIDKSNKSDPKQLVKFLIKNGIMTKKIYLGHIRILTNNCKIKPRDCLSTKKYAKIYANFKRFLFSKKLSTNNYCFEGPKKYFCKANNFNSFVIDPNLNFYRCENLLGSNKHTLENSFIKNSANIYDNWTAFKIDKCKKCILLPSCYGGCAHMYFVSNNSIQCPYYKYTFKQDVKLLVKQFN